MFRPPLSPIAMARHLPVRSWGLTVLQALLPSFIADLVFPEQRQAWPIHPTSYLDGLRGLASFIVFIHHFTQHQFGGLKDYYGVDPGWTCFLQLPYARVISSGTPMVHIFFVISGFVLSYKPIKSIHAHDMASCYAALASSTFRRPFRLFGPCIIYTFAIILLMQTGYIGSPMESFAAQFWDWKAAIHDQITWPWNWEDVTMPWYTLHLWTIPIEFSYSMLLFIAILMVSRVRRLVRQAMLFGLMIYLLSCRKWAGFEFLAGMFLAELHILEAAAQQQQQQQLTYGWEILPELPEDGSTQETKRKRTTARFWPTLRNVVCIASLAVGFYIAGWPEAGAAEAPGIRVLFAQTPSPFGTNSDGDPSKFWFALGAVLITWPCGELMPIKRFLESGFAQYLGRTSYAIYITHPLVMDVWEGKVAGYPPAPAQGEPGAPDFHAEQPGRGVKGLFGTDTPLQYQLSWFFSICVIGCILIWVADVFWRLIDKPIVKWARKIELACLEGAESSWP